MDEALRRAGQPGGGGEGDIRRAVCVCGGCDHKGNT